MRDETGDSQPQGLQSHKPRSREGERRSALGSLRPLLGLLRREARWMLPCSLSMAIFQSLMYIPFILGPLGVGLGALMWWSPLITASFFLALSVTMLARGLTARLGMQAARPIFRMGGTQACIFAIGQLLLVFQVLVDDEALRLAVSCVGAVACGYVTACCQLLSANHLARLKPVMSFGVILVAQVPTAVVLLYALLAPSVWFGIPLALLALAAMPLIPRWEQSLPYEALHNASDGPEVLGQNEPPNIWRAATVTACAVMAGALAVFVARYWLEMAVDTGIASPPGPLMITTSLLLVTTCVLFATMLLCLRTRTVFLTLVFRVVIPPLAIAILIVSLYGGTEPSQLTCCVVAALLTAFALTLLDQMIWMLTAGFMRADEMVSELVVTRMRALQFLGAALGACLVPPLVSSWGITETLFVALALLLVAFVVCVPAFEPHLVSPGQVVPASLRNLDATGKGNYAMLVAHYGLTARESEVFALLMDGADAAAIANRLYVSVSTANTHIRHIYAKFDVHSRAELVAKAGVLEE